MKTSPAMIIWWKEIRSILPLWLGVLLAMWLPELLGFRLFWLDQGAWLVFSSVIGGACLATSVYAREFHDRTMFWQLVQPVSRLSTLGRKFALLLFALAPVVASLVALQSIERYGSSRGWFVLGSLVAIGLTSVCLLSILTRNILATAVMTLVLPSLVVLLVSPWEARLAREFGLTSDTITIGALLLYSLLTGIAALFLWRRIELRSDAVAVSGFDIRWFSRFTSDGAFKARLPGTALFRKELGLLRFVFWSTLLFLVAVVVYVIASFVIADAVEKAFSEGLRLSLGDTHPALARSKEVLEGLGMMAFLFLLALVPALCGGLAFAEETYFGTRAWQLCQAVGFSRQWLVKIGTAAGLSVLAGLFLPIATYLILSVLLPTGYLMAPGALKEIEHVLPGLICGSILVFAFSAWCASWSRTTAAGLAKALLIGIGFSMLNIWVATWFGPDIGWFNWQLAAWPAAGLALVFTYPNFKAVEMPARRWGVQLIALAFLNLAIGFGYGIVVKVFGF